MYSRVPKGSALEPLLLLLCVSKIGSGLENSYLIFCDDITQLGTANSEKTQRDLGKVS